MDMVIASNYIPSIVPNGVKTKILFMYKYN